MERTSVYLIIKYCIYDYCIYDVSCKEVIKTKEE